MRIAPRVSTPWRLRHGHEVARQAFLGEYQPSVLPANPQEPVQTPPFSRAPPPAASFLSPSHRTAFVISAPPADTPLTELTAEQPTRLCLDPFVPVSSLCDRANSSVHTSASEA